MNEYRYALKNLIGTCINKHLTT